MNKLLLSAALVLGLTASASAYQDETHNGKTVAVPGAAHSKGVFAPAIQLTPHGTVVTAPPGADVDVDNEDGEVSVDISPAGKRGLLGLGVLGL